MKPVAQTLRALMPNLPVSARRFLILYASASSLLAVLDIAALMLLAVTFAAMATGGAMNLPVLGAVSSDSVGGILVAVCVIITLKSIGAAALQWGATRRFAQYELQVGETLFNAYIRSPWTERLRRSTPQLVRMADVGIAAVFGGFLVPLSTVPSLVTTFAAVIVVLLVAQPLIALVTMMYLALVAACLFLFVTRKANQAGRVNRDYSFRVATLMSDMMGALKEITLRGSAASVADVVLRNRRLATIARANLSFLGAIPRYVYDAALVGGFLLVGAVAWTIGGPAQAFSSIALFGIAGFRIVPSLTGFQSIVTQAQASVPIVRAVISDIVAAEPVLASIDVETPLEFEPTTLTLKNVGFTYPGSAAPALTDVDLTIPLGSSVGLVGSSGAGKSTLVDIMLGLLDPTAGDVLIDSVPLGEVVSGWRSRVGYVPQEVMLFSGSIAQNVALTWSDDFDEDRVRRALERAQLLDVVEAREGGLHGSVGDRGIALSGGQRQRLGIARALYSEPLVLVMDEATSALDTKTESAVADAIRRLHGEVTVLAIAHRLSTIRESDQVCFMREGTIVARGSFEEVVRAEPEFAEQAALAGLGGAE